MAKLIAVTGGKGGTGKSTVATALAFELAKKKRVLLVDADVDCPNDHLLLSIERRQEKQVDQRIPKFDLDKCSRCGKCGKVCKKNALISIKGKFPIFLKQQCNGCGACFLECPEGAISWDKKVIGKVFSGSNHNVELLSGELLENEPVSEFIVNQLKSMIKAKEQDYDYVIIDTAAGTHCPVIAALEGCHQVICVTEPTPLGAHDLEIILRLLRRLNLAPSIVINRSDIGNMDLIIELLRKHKLKVISQIPYSMDIVRQYSKGLPIQADFVKEVIKQL